MQFRLALQAARGRYPIGDAKVRKGGELFFHSVLRLFYVTSYPRGSETHQHRSSFTRLSARQWHLGCCSCVRLSRRRPPIVCIAAGSQPHPSFASLTVL